jgi:uncharacterized damage-inducible protein DinB
MDQEAKATRRLLERVPEERLTWKPHPKSMSLGQLALHVAQVNGNIAGMGASDSFAVNLSDLNVAQPQTSAEILSAFENGLSRAHELLSQVDDQKIMGMWSMTLGGNPIMTMPRVGLYRVLMCSHQYHHRGQLTVYLRLLDIPLPSVYGPSADENPFAG